jgi:hypothetical protein
VFFWSYILLVFGGQWAGNEFQLKEALLMGVAIGVLFGIGAGIIDGLRIKRGPPADSGAVRESAWRTAGRVAMHWLNFAVAMVLSGADLARIAFGLIWSLLFGLRGRGRNVSNDIYTVEALGWSWKGAGKGALRGMGIGVLLSVAGAFLTLLGVEFWTAADDLRLPAWMLWTVRLTAWVPLFGATGFALGGLTGRSLPTTAKPNQGIRLSIRNAIFGGTVQTAVAVLITTSTITLMMFTLMPGQISEVMKNAGLPPSGWLAFILVFFAVGISLGLMTGLYAGVIGGLIYGGMDAVQHAVLRYQLRLSGAVPRHYARFLDYTVELVFMRKVGGGYLFVHRLLLEHFARTERLASPNQPTKPKE